MKNIDKFRKMSAREICEILFDEMADVPLLTANRVCKNFESWLNQEIEPPEDVEN